MAKVLGSKVESRKPTGFAGAKGTSCQWTGVNLAGPNSYAVHRTLTISVSPGTLARFNKFAREVQGAIRVTGLGESAFRQGNGNLTDLEIWHRGYSLSIIANLVSNPLAAEKAAAKIALARL